MNYAAIVSANTDDRHNETCPTGSHVYMIFSDGEVVLTKGGELFGQRNWHVIEVGGPSHMHWPPEAFPHRVKNFGMGFTDKTGAAAIRAAMGLSFNGN